MRRRARRGRRHRRAQRARRREHRAHLGARPLPHGRRLPAGRGAQRQPRRARGDGRGGDAAAGAARATPGRASNRLRIPGLGRALRSDRPSPGDALEPRHPAPPVDRRHRRRGRRARARRAGARAAPRLPRRGQRPGRQHDPHGLRPHRRGLRAGRQRAAAAGRRAARRARGRRRSTRSCAPRAPIATSPYVVGAPARAPTGARRSITVAPRSSPQAEATTALVQRLRDDVVPRALAGSGVTVDVGGATAELRRPERPRRAAAAALHRRRRRAVVPAPAERLPLAADRAEGRRDEPAVGRRGVRRDGAVRRRRVVRQRPAGHRPRHAGGAVHPGDDVRDPVRAVDGLRGLPALARARGVPRATATRRGR